MRLYFPELEPWVTRSASLPAVHPVICGRMWGRGVLPAALPAPFSATLSPALWVYLCTNVGPQGPLVVRLPAPFVPHSASLGPATATRVLSAPVLISAPPTSLDECFFLFPWCWSPLLFDSLSVLVVRGGAVCPPTLPSSFYPAYSYFLPRYEMLGGKSSGKALLAAVTVNALAT